MKVRRIFSDFELVDATFTQIRYYINRNFNKCIKLLIGVYGRTCIVCDTFSPEFFGDSGTAGHYYSRHREDTIDFIRDNFMIKSEDEIQDMILDE